jgi:hypothetical protein
MLDGTRRQRMILKQRYVTAYSCKWCQLTDAQGVYMGSGIGSLDDVYNTTVAYEKGVRCDQNNRLLELILARDTRRYPPFSSPDY